MSIFEYDFARHMAAISEESREEGYRQGQEELLKKMIQRSCQTGSRQNRLRRNLSKGRNLYRLLSLR